MPPRELVKIIQVQIPAGERTQPSNLIRRQLASRAKKKGFVFGAISRTSHRIRICRRVVVTVSGFSTNQVSTRMLSQQNARPRRISEILLTEFWLWSISQSATHDDDKGPRPARMGSRAHNLTNHFTFLDSGFCNWLREQSSTRVQEETS